MHWRWKPFGKWCGSPIFNSLGRGGVRMFYISTDCWYLGYMATAQRMTRTNETSGWNSFVMWNHMDIHYTEYLWIALQALVHKKALEQCRFLRSLLALVALALGATGRLFGRFWNCETEELLLTVFGGFGSCGEISPCKLEVCRTVPNRSGDLCAKSARKLVLCAKNPGSRKARTRLNHSGCIRPNLKVTHHHPQEPHR